MPRVGRHPLKGVHEIGEFTKDITITTIIHAPTLGGYWKNYLDILDLFFSSLYRSTELPFDLMVFDNASCPEVKEYLLNMQDSGKIQCLTLSKYNLRKTGALNFLLSTAPGDFVAYSDCDVYFLPGWLENSIEILNTFPKAGKITAIPVAMNTSSDAFQKFFQNAVAEAVHDISIEVFTGSLVADGFINAHAASLSEPAEQYLSRLGDRKDYLIRKSGVDAFISGADFQFTMPKRVLQAILPFNYEIFPVKGDAIYQGILEQNLAEKGYWQLSSTNYSVHHLGNQIPDFSKELPWLDPASFPSGVNPEINQLTSKNKINRERPLSHRLISNRFTRKFLKKIYLYLYKILYE
ncbi:MAG: glycosyltransferase family A protein [Brevefilum sp.]|jgi:glycosyltransferase involved in cell wall biosynthesis